MRGFRSLLGAVALLVGFHVGAQTVARVEDIPARPGVTQRAIVLSPANPKAAVVLLPGGHGESQVFPNGCMKWGDNNFLVCTRQLFADEGPTVVVLDAPSGRQRPPCLGGFRQTPEHGR